MTPEPHPNQRELASLPVELRRTSVPAAVRGWIEGQTGASVVRVRRLAGASTTAIHGIYLSTGMRLVLRRYVWPKFLEVEPLAPTREADALRFAVAAGLAVPDVVASDPTGAEVGDGIAVILMTFLSGQALAVPDLARLAEVAASIHAVSADSFGHEYFPWYRHVTTRPPECSTQPALWERAIELWHDHMPDYRPMFIHRDFHPGNVLWSRGQVSGVVDWVDACRGPWGCDVAHCRANLIGLSGLEAADRFLAAYESLTGETFQPYWEIASELEHGPSNWTPDQLEESEPRIARALTSL